MSKQTEALKLALEALEMVNRTDLCQVNLAIAAIKEAQAEQAQQQPFGYIKPGEGDYEKVFSWNRNERTGYTQALYTTPQPPAQPLTDDKYEAIVEDLADWSRYVEVDTAHQSLEAHVREVLTAHGITKGGAA